MSSPPYTSGPVAIGGANPAPVSRGPTARELTQIKWDYVVTTSGTLRGDGTSVQGKREALPLETAFRQIAGADPRPLLVLRECPVCNKTDNALLRPRSDNERTILLAHWFHCVKLPVDVIQPDQPFNALFPTNDAEHLFVCAVDGSGRIPLESDTSRPELWAAMGKVLAATYVRDPAAATKEILRSYDKLDALDARIKDLVKSRDDLLENPGHLDKEKVKKLDGEIETAKKSVEDQKKVIERLGRIELKPANKG